MSDYLSRLVARTMLAPEIRPRLQPLYGSASDSGVQEITEYTETEEAERAPAAARRGTRRSAAPRRDAVPFLRAQPEVPPPSTAPTAGEFVPADIGLSSPILTAESGPELQLNLKAAASDEIPAQADPAPAAAVRAENDPFTAEPPVNPARSIADSASRPRTAVPEPLREMPSPVAVMSDSGHPIEPLEGIITATRSSPLTEPADRPLTGVPGGQKSTGVNLAASGVRRASRNTAGPPDARRAPRPVHPPIWPASEAAPAAGGPLPVADREEAAEPAIQVTIGRLEIRAAMAPALPVRRAEPVHQSVSLEEYLRRRAKGPRS
jgi:hypothetical protein